MGNVNITRCHGDALGIDGFVMQIDLDDDGARELLGMYSTVRFSWNMQYESST